MTLRLLLCGHGDWPGPGEAHVETVLPAIFKLCANLNFEIATTVSG